MIESGASAKMVQLFDFLNQMGVRRADLVHAHGSKWSQDEQIAYHDGRWNLVDFDNPNNQNNHQKVERMIPLQNCRAESNLRRAVGTELSKIYLEIKDILPGRITTEKLPKFAKLLVLHKGSWLGVSETYLYRIFCTNNEGRPVEIDHSEISQIMIEV